MSPPEPNVPPTEQDPAEELFDELVAALRGDAREAQKAGRRMLALDVDAVLAMADDIEVLRASRDLAERDLEALRAVLRSYADPTVTLEQRLELERAAHGADVGCLHAAFRAVGRAGVPHG
jgi:hypothetical protein